jgi:ketosteroid isomerase-like protein
MAGIKFTKSFMVGLCLLGAVVLCGCATSPSAPARNTAPKTKTNQPAPAPLSIEGAATATAAATRQVIAAEQAFAKTMADRNFKAFVTFLSPNAVFFSGSEVTRGPAAVASKWETYFTGREAPFSWSPDEVEVSASGDLALSTGPVFQNHKIVGRFSSIWRLEAPNSWRIVFDKGEAICGMTPP